MRTLYLHIGCGKTGSSALQVWLWNNSSELESQGVLYPRFGDSALDGYAITSGNGVHFIREFKSGGLESFLKGLSQPGGIDNDLLFSSEQFQGLTDDEIKSLKACTEKLGYQTKIIAFVRDVYDIAYSSYVQLVKRHGLYEEFRDYALKRNTLQQFTVVRRFCKFYDSVDVIHYDSAKKVGLDAALASSLGVKLSKTMSANKVNRSLSVAELEVLRLFNESFGGASIPDDVQFQISDCIISSNPEKTTEIFYDSVVEDHFKEVLREDIRFVNGHLSEGELKVFDPDGKVVVQTKSKALYPDVVGVLSSVFCTLSKMASFSAPPKPTLVKPSLNQVIPFLLAEAEQKEHVNLASSLTLAKAAGVLRPEGPVIKKRISEYEMRLGSETDS